MQAKASYTWRSKVREMYDYRRVKDAWQRVEGLYFRLGEDKVGLYAPMHDS